MPRTRTKPASDGYSKVHTRRVLQSLGLSPTILKMIEAGTLEAEVAEARQRWRALSAALDAWEARNPAAAAAVPWARAREAWKAQGRPEPAWWELILEPHVKIQGARDISMRLLQVPPYYDRKRTERRAAQRKAKGLAGAHKATRPKWQGFDPNA